MTKTVQIALAHVKTKRTKKSRIPSGMETPATRLKQLRLDMGYKSAAEACVRFGWIADTYRTHENGNREISKRAAKLYADAYNSSVDYILFGKRHTSKKSSASTPVELASQPVPLLSWQLIGSVKSKIEMLKLETSETAYVSRRSQVTGRCRVVIVGDDSAVDVMRIYRHSIYLGDEVYFDPDADPSPGDLVIAYHPLILKPAPRVFTLKPEEISGKFVVELVPLNPAYPPIRMLPDDGSYIAGKVIKYMRSI